MYWVKLFEWATIISLSFDHFNHSDWQDNNDKLVTYRTLVKYCLSYLVMYKLQVMSSQKYVQAYASLSHKLSRGSFLIKCLQIIPNFAYIWGVSLRLPDLACPIEVGRPYLHLLADHGACRLCRGRWRRRWRLWMRSWRLHQWREFSHRRIRCCYLWWK